MLMRTLVVALSLLMGAGLSSNVAQSADLPVVEGSGTLFQMGSVTRRGVRIENGTLLIRFDGCWFSDLRAANGNPGPVDLSVTYRWQRWDGIEVFDIPAVVREPIDGGGTGTFNTQGCDPTLARYYDTLARGGMARIVSVR